MHTQEKKAKIEQINRVRNKLQEYSKEYTKNKKALKKPPKLEISIDDQLLLQEIIVLAKDSIRGIQTALFPDENLAKTND
ncbi:hypothetical protein [Bernardetia sp. MNP-M8]|uniref:hypothetical protein n=1 Tax=Bernardetia sp. MNP-M8 TaxID=3127470 RepID=UPI0030D3664E